MEGKWRLRTYNSTIHSSLKKAKSHCTKVGNCFGVEVGATAGEFNSVTFPIRLIKGGDFYIHKKEN